MRIYTIKWSYCTYFLEEFSLSWPKSCAKCALCDVVVGGFQENKTKVNRKIKQVQQELSSVSFFNSLTLKYQIKQAGNRI